MRKLAWMFIGCCLASGAGAASERFVVSHFNVALDRATYEAIRAAPEIAAFAATESRSTVAGEMKYSGFYVYGRRTFMEFYSEDALPEKTQVGDFSIGLDSEAVDGIEPLLQRLRARYADDVDVGKQVRTTVGGDIPWFTYASLKSDEGAPAAIWFSEIDAHYLGIQHPEAHIVNPLSREEYLASLFRPDKQLEDIVGFSLLLAPPEAAHVESLLELAGWQIRHDPGGFTATGPEMKIAARRGIRSALRSVEFRLRHPVTPHGAQLGRAQLHLQGDRGTLNFLP